MSKLRKNRPDLKKCLRFFSGAGRAFLIPVAILLTLFSGCQPSIDHRIHLQLSTWGNAEEIRSLRRLVTQYEKKHPQIDIEILHIPDNYYQKLHLLIAGGMIPDIVFINSLSFPVYAPHHLFRDLTPFLAHSKTLRPDMFFSAALAAFRMENNDLNAGLGALPRDVSDLVIFYNRTLFRQAGLPEPAEQAARKSWTWAAFLDSAQKLTNASGGRFGFSFYDKPPLYWLPFVWSAGGDIFDAGLKQCMLFSPQSLAGLTFYRDLAARWHVAPEKKDSGGATMTQLFLQQKIAMMLNGRWAVPVLRQQANFSWDIAPFPQGPAGSKVGIDASGYAISTACQYPREAWAFLEYLLSDAAVSEVTRSGLIIPSRKDIAESPVFLSTTLAPAHGAYFLTAIRAGVPSHTPPRWNEISEEIGLALEPVWEGKTTPEAALKPVMPHIQMMLEKTGGS